MKFSVKYGRMEIEKRMESHEIVIVGAGASGLMCGYLLAARGKDVCIVEKNQVAGKKLAATGNGRCNFTNEIMSPECYYGDSAFIKEVLDQFSAKDAKDAFEELGISTRVKDGYCYPYNGQASTVKELLVEACEERGVSFVMDTKVRRVVHKKESAYELQCEGGVRLSGERLVLATGGKANRPLGGDGSGYMLSRSLGHTVSPVYPGLTGLIAEGDYWGQLAGVRMQAKFSLYADSMLLGEETGEIQIVKDGVSGIPVFQLCRLAAQALDQGKEVTGSFDLVPQMTSEQLTEWYQVHGSKKMVGLLNKKWIPVLGKLTGDSRTLLAALKDYRFSITDTFGMEKAQVSAGGVVTSEICAHSMESRIHSDLYLLGELLDVDGICGGYNLHFAWATATICSRTIV